MDVEEEEAVVTPLTPKINRNKMVIPIEIK